MSTAQKDYLRLFSLSKEVHLFGAIEQLLNWDQETYMPHAAAQARAEQIELLSKITHEKQCSKTFRQALAKLIDIDSGEVVVKGLSHSQKAALREWRRDYLHRIKLPTKFVQAFAKLASESTLIWRVARKENAFIKFAPCLERLIEMSKERAEYLGYEEHPYDALLDQFEEGMTQHKVALVFNRLKEPLCKLRNQALKKRAPKDDFLHQLYPQEKQLAFASELLTAFDFQSDRARLDLTTHPFCTVPHPLDGRITTRVNVRDPMTNIGAVIHEAGHYLYEAQLPSEHYGSPLCQAISMGIHESQSRWWETLIGQSKPFWSFYFPKLKALFKKQLQNISLPQFYAVINRISSTPIRIDSDEVSYPLHIITRFELEADLIKGKLKVRDIPEAWNAKMVEYLGIHPKNDTEGCLQDIHWSLGAFGYFPTYALGNLYAAQFFKSFAKDHPDWEKQVAKGSFGFMREWLKQAIHQHGRTYGGAELVKRVTGHALAADAYLEYLRKKYL